MQRYIARRLVQAVLTVFLVAVIVFSLTRLTGDPLSLMVPPESTPEQYQKMAKALGLDKPIYVQFGIFVSKAVRGDFGKSIRWGKPAFELFRSRFPATLQLALAGALIAMLIGVPTGVLSAMKVGGPVDRFGKVFALMGQSMPVFWVALLLILLFAVYLRVLPTAGKGGIDHLILPAFTLGWFFTAALLRLTRSAMLDVLDSEHIKMARIKGLPERMVIGKHALKNAAIPVVTMGAMQVVALLNGTVITETIFAWPGVGRLAVDAIFSRDYPVVQMCVLVGSVLFVTANLVVDILYGYLDPRIRYQ